MSELRNWLDRDTFERDAERGSVGPVGDFLACGKGSQNEFDRVRTAVRSTECRRFIDRQ